MVTIKQPLMPEDMRVISTEEAFEALLAGDDEDIEYLLVRGIRLRERLIEKRFFSHMRFENCRFESCRFNRCNFTDIVFTSCDFSAARFADCHAARISLATCKLTGTGIFSSTLQHITARWQNLHYANIDDCKAEYIQLEECDFTEGFITRCRQLDIRLKQCTFVKTSFAGTKLRGINFIGSVLEGITLSNDCSEIKGAVVDMYQAAEMAKLMGLIVEF